MSYDTTEVLKEFDEEFTYGGITGTVAFRENKDRPYEVKNFFSSALQKAYEEGEAHGAVKERERTKELQHFYDTTIGLMATDKPIEAFNGIVSEAVRRGVGCLGYDDLTGDLKSSIILIAQQKMLDLMWRVEPVEALQGEKSV